MIDISFILISIVLIILILVILQHLELKKMSSKIMLMERVRNKLYEVAENITKATKEDEVYSLILDTAIQLIPNATKGSILVLEEDCLFHFKTVQGYSQELKKLTLKREEAYLFNINNFSAAAIIKNPNRFDENVMDKESVSNLQQLEALDISCTLSSPIYIDDKLIGMINVDSTIRNKTFSEEDLALMNYIRNELQLALKNSFIQSKLKFMANFDELTGLYNRRYFKQFFIKECLRIKRYRTIGCLALIDLDDFKLINDNYGHNMGDKALKLFADVLKENIRQSDFYGRMSGDEFVILFVNCERAQAEEKLESIRKIVQQKRLGSITLGFSYGICKIDADSDLNPDEIFGTADKKMYLDKGKKAERSFR